MMKPSVSGVPARCADCGKPITPDEIAVTRKLINRGTKIWYCTDCLARRFEVTRADILERIAYFRAMGCTLFEEQPQRAGFP